MICFKNRCWNLEYVCVNVHIMYIGAALALCTTSSMYSSKAVSQDTVTFIWWMSLDEEDIVSV